tara:strand:- start:1187 stop:1666 length:480 start_codon:yes stop_codon:yes gene_type:complete
MASVRCDLGVAAVIVKDNSVLLVKEATGRYSGHWGLPKGYVDDGELPRDAALRELREECDVDGTVTGIYAIRENLTEIGPAVFIAYSVELTQGQIPVASSEIEEAKFIDVDKFDDLNWVSIAMKSIATNALVQTPFSTLDYSDQRGYPYLLHQNGGVKQ